MRAGDVSDSSPANCVRGYLLWLSKEDRHQVAKHKEHGHRCRLKPSASLFQCDSQSDKHSAPPSICMSRLVSIIYYPMALFLAPTRVSNSFSLSARIMRSIVLLEKTSVGCYDCNGYVCIVLNLTYHSHLFQPKAVKIMMFPKHHFDVLKLHFEV